MSQGRSAFPWSSRTMRLIAICWAAWTALLLSPVHSSASPIIVFGDSSSDAGNAYYATNGYYPPPPYAEGRFSNGPTWVQQLAWMLHAPTPIPSLKGGTDYAFGGAATGPTPLGTELGTPAGLSPLRTPTGLFVTNVPSLPTQVAGYIAGLKGKTPAAGTLATIWAGANDSLDGQQNPAGPARNIANVVSELIHAGIKNFLIPNLPDLSKSPLGLASPTAIQQELHAFIVGFNKDLSADLRSLASMSGVHIHTLDAYSLFRQMETNPAKFHLTNVTGEGILSGKMSAPGYLFWDNVHPTTFAHRIIATQAAATLQTNTHPGVETAGAPEPPSLTLLAVGLFGLLGRGWRRRTAS